jgi:hypothetical protein
MDEISLIAERLALEAEKTANILAVKMEESVRANQREHEEIRTQAEKNFDMMKRMEETIKGMEDKLTEMYLIYLPGKLTLQYSAGLIRFVVKLIMVIGAIAASAMAVWNFLHKKI